MKMTSLLILATALSGCAHMKIDPLLPTTAQDWHDGDSSRKGYLVYSPRVFVKVELSTVCAKEGADGACAETQEKCAIGDQFVLPNYEKPYVVRFKGGLGSATSTFKLTNGWLLSEATSTRDISGVINSVLAEGLDEKSPCATGLYELTGAGLQKFWPRP